MTARLRWIPVVTASSNAGHALEAQAAHGVDHISAAGLVDHRRYLSIASNSYSRICRASRYRRKRLLKFLTTLAIGAVAALSAQPALAETVTFENLTSGLQAPGSISYPGVTFTSTSGLFSVNAGTTGNALCAFQDDCSAALIIDFTRPASNVRFNFSGDEATSELGFQGESTTASFTGRIFADGDPLTQDIFNLSIVPNITQLIVFSNDPGGVIFDNFSFDTAVAGVPEPATWAMMIGGFGLIGGAMRRRRVGTTFSPAQ